MSRRSIMNGFGEKVSRRGLVRIAAVFCALGAAGVLQAQPAWPGKPIRLVVGFAAGGGTDVMARMLAQPLAESLGKPVIVDNKPGASGNLSVAEVVRAAPDGYTFLVAPTSVETANPTLFKSSHLPARDLKQVAGVARMRMYVVARNTLPVKDVKELIALAKSNPDTLSFASSGSGTPPHLAAELFKQQTGVPTSHVPYRGSAPALQDVIGGHADYVFDPGIALPHIREGKVKLLGVASASRSPFFPDSPTLAEQGVEGAVLDIWFGVWAPKNTPAQVTDRLEQELAKVLAAPALKQRFAEIATEAVMVDSAAFRKLLDDEAKLLTGLIRDRNITAN